MRHKMSGRTLGRNASHRKAMFSNMATSLILTLDDADDLPNKARAKGRIVTTVAKAKELRPYVEKLITLARKALPHLAEAKRHGTSAARNSSEWKAWREGDGWKRWNKAIAPAVSYRRRAFAQLRNQQAVSILFDELAPRFENRPGGYTRVMRLTTRRLGDGGEQAIFEFVGVHDRVKSKRVRPAAPVVSDVSQPAVPAAEPAATAGSPPSEAAPAAPPPG